MGQNEQSLTSLDAFRDHHATGLHLLVGCVFLVDCMGAGAVVNPLSVHAGVLCAFWGEDTCIMSPLKVLRRVEEDGKLLV